MASLRALPLQTKLSAVFAFVGLLALVVAATMRCSTEDTPAAVAKPEPTQAPAASGPPVATLANLGIRMAYVREGGGGVGDLVIHNPDDSVIPIRGLRGFFTGTAWSPDGTQLAFSFGPSADLQDIWTVSSDGSNAKQLTADGRSSQPTWAPDGLTIAFVSGARGQPRTIATLRTDGSGTRPIGIIPGQEHPAWAPDGSSIAASGPAGTVRLIDPAAGTPMNTVQLLRDSEPSTTSLSWSGDSALLAGVVLRGSKLAVVILGDSLTAQRQVGGAILGSPADPASTHPSFAPNNATVIAASSETGDILALDINALPTDTVSTGNGEVQVLVKAPSGTQFAYPAVSPIGGARAGGIV